MTEREENNSADYGAWTDLIRGLEGHCYNLAADLVMQGKLVEQLTDAIQYTLDYMFDGEEPRYDEDGDVICPASLLRAALSQARGETGEEG